MIETKSYGKFELIVEASNKKNRLQELCEKTLSIPCDGLFDVIKILESKTGRFQFSANKKEISNRNNTIVKAAEYFFTQNPSLKQGIRIELTKNIPLGSGLSGASSNAISALKLIYKYFNLPCSELALVRFAHIINPNALFFVYSQPALYNSKNNKFKIINFPSSSVGRISIHTNPDISPDRRKVAEQFLHNYKYYIKNTIKHDKYFNNLELPTFDVYPELYERSVELKRKYEHVLLSGCGSTFICYNQL